MRTVTLHTIKIVAACALSTLALGIFNPVFAQSVALSGTMGSKALLVVDGSAPKSVGVGETHQGVKVISANGEHAVVEIKGQRSTLIVGGAPVSIGAKADPASIGAKADPASSNKIVLPMGSGGHFFALGMVNRKPMQFMVDTGATTVAFGVSDAQRLGIDYEKGRPVRMGTANGQAQGWMVKLSSVRIGDVEVYDVDAIVGPNMPYALLGNSFLSRFSMNRSSDTMVLERRY